MPRCIKIKLRLKLSGKIHISVFKMFLAFLLCAVADNYRLQPACEALLYEAAVLRLR